MNCEQIINLNPEGAETLQLNSECLTVSESYDYNRSYNKPRINGVELVGNKTSSEIHVQHEMDEISNQDIDNIIYA